MEQYNNKFMSKIANFINKNSSETTKSYIIFTILAGILTLTPVSTLVLGLIDPNEYINDNIYIISFYIVKIIGFLIYFCVLKEITKSKSIMVIIAVVFLLMSGFMYNEMNGMENTGIDYIGQALGMAIIFKLCIYIYYIFTFILFIAYAKKFIFKKKAIITIIAIVLIALLAFATKGIRHYTSVQKVDDYIPSVSNFENELVERNLYTNEYLLFGIDNIENNIHKIDFDSASNEKYPSYIYYGYKTKNVSKNINKNDDYLYWIIYYTNGKMYATLVDYFESSYPNSYSIYSNILGEEKELYIYNMEENYYEKVDVEEDGILTKNLYYRGNGMYISIDVLEKSSFGYIEYLCEKYEVIGKINSDILDNYANNLKEEN